MSVAQTLAAARATNAHVVFMARYAKPIEPVFEIDSKGRKVRVFTREFPCTREDVRQLFLNVRALHEDEVLEGVGKNVLAYGLSSGFLVRDKRHPSTLYVTKKCAAAYDLPFFFGPDTFFY